MEAEGQLDRDTGGPEDRAVLKSPARKSLPRAIERGGRLAVKAKRSSEGQPKAGRVIARRRSSFLALLAIRLRVILSHYSQLQR